ncbi:MAG: leucyl aminopeptidase [Verrucomicrobiota bacterium]
MSEEFEHTLEPQFSAFWPLLILLTGFLIWFGFQDYELNNQRSLLNRQFDTYKPSLAEAQNINTRYLALMRDLVQTAQKDQYAAEIVKAAIQARADPRAEQRHAGRQHRHRQRHGHRHLDEVGAGSDGGRRPPGDGGRWLCAHRKEPRGPSRPAPAGRGLPPSPQPLPARANAVIRQGDMPSLKIDVRSTPAGSPDQVHFSFKGDARPTGVPASEFDGAPGSTVLLHNPGFRLVLAGLGEKAKLEPDTLRKATGAAVKALLKAGAGEIALNLTAFPEYVTPAVEGAVLAAYKFEGFGKDPSKKGRGVLTRLQVVVKDNEVTAARVAAREAEIVASLTNTIRDIGNLPGNLLTPAILAEKAQELAHARPLAVKVWNERHLKRDGFGGILAVGQGSVHPPRLIVLEYRGGPKREAPIALVGKAVTFDTGGISLKPGAAMDEMKWDKMGGLAVLGMILAAADLKLPVNLVALIPSAENMPGPDAYRPGDIITTRDGKTVEVLNTDAEGRIILVDAVAHARLSYKPSVIVEFSTLTGACVMALGHRRAGLFTAIDKLRDALVAAGRSTGELLWPMPVDDEYRENILSEIATAKNTSAREGSACSSASFVKLWAEETPFAHIDIAGTAWTTKPPAHLEGGATGFGLRLIIAALKAGLPVKA